MLKRMFSDATKKRATFTIWIILNLYIIGQIFCIWFNKFDLVRVGSTVPQIRDVSLGPLELINDNQKKNKRLRKIKKMLISTCTLYRVILTLFLKKNFQIDSVIKDATSFMWYHYIYMYVHIYSCHIFDHMFECREEQNSKIQILI